MTSTQLPGYLYMSLEPNAYIYSDKRKQKSGDYHKIAHVYFRPLRLKILDHSKRYRDAIAQAIKDYEYIKANIDKPIILDGTRQTVMPFLEDASTDKCSVCYVAELYPVKTNFRKNFVKRLL